jgi:uncharacterized protein (TIRG00374 family)
MWLSFRRLRIPSWLIPALGYVISAACLVWVLRGVNFSDVWLDIRDLHWGWVAAGVLADVAVYFYQAFRWNLLLQPVTCPSLWRSVQAIYVGLFSNEVLPLRPGELIRAYLQARWSRVPFSVSLSSAIIERILDGIWLVVVFVLVAGQAGVAMPRKLADLARVLGVVVAICAALLALVMFWKHHAHAAMPPTKLGARLRVLIDDLHVMGRSKSFYYGALASLPYLLIQVIPVYALIRAYDLELGVIPATVVLVLWRLATVIPQAPGTGIVRSGQDHRHGILAGHLGRGDVAAAAGRVRGARAHGRQPGRPARPRQGTRKEPAGGSSQRRIRPWKNDSAPCPRWMKCSPASSVCAAASRTARWRTKRGASWRRRGR